VATEVTVRKLTSGFMVSTPRSMRDGVIVEEAFAESTRPAMIQRVLRCLNIEPAEVYVEANEQMSAEAYLRRLEREDDTGETYSLPGCATGSCGL
jgi:hypothetical protein